VEGCFVTTDQHQSAGTLPDRSRGRFVLVGCGDAKADEPREARDLYTSSYFVCKRRYAEAATQWARTVNRRANCWAVLSAEYGVVPSRLEIEPYDTTTDDLSGTPIDGEPDFRLPTGDPVETELDQWALRVQMQLREWLARPFAADQETSPCRELVILAGSDYVDALRDRDVFDGRATSVHTGEPSLRGLPPKATVRFPFQDDDIGGLFEQQAWLADRADELKSSTAPRRRCELSTFGAGYERERARWNVGRPSLDVEETEQVGLQAFEDVPEECVADTYEQSELSTLVAEE